MIRLNVSRSEIGTAAKNRRSLENFAANLIFNRPTESEHGRMLVPEILNANVAYFFEVAAGFSLRITQPKGCDYLGFRMHPRWHLSWL
jgi:hypothetical protein